MGTTSTTTTTINVGWTFDPGGCDIKAVPAQVSTIVSAYNLGFALCEDDVCCAPPKSYFSDDTDVDNGDALLRTISASASTMEGAATASGSATPGGGNVSVSATCSFWNYNHYVIIDPDIIYTGHTTNIDLAVAPISVAQQWVLDCPPDPKGITFLPTISFDASGSRSVFAKCDEIETEGPTPVSRDVSIDTMTMEIEVEYANATSATEVIQAVYGIDTELNPVRLGVFASPAFAGTASPGQFNVSSGAQPVPTTISLQDAAAVSIRVSTDHFAQLDGDLNADRQLCWADRHHFQTLLGLDLADAGYTARADLDLDGDIDAADFSAFIAIFNQTACAADYDCSGAVNSQDFFEFNADWMANDPKADFNGNGVINSQDWNDFLTAFFTGC